MTVEKDAAYQTLVDSLSPKPPYLKNCLLAFTCGGGICLLAQAIQIALINWAGFTQETVGNPTAAIMVFLAVLFTALGWYDKFAQIAGAGSAVPITGFGNCMASAALEYRSEGFVLGVGGNMFKVAGPVIVFGSVAAFLVAIIYYGVVTLL